MSLTLEQKALLESGLNNLETGIFQLNSAIESFDKKRSEFAAQRDDALRKVAEVRKQLGITTVYQ